MAKQKTKKRKGGPIRTLQVKYLTEKLKSHNAPFAGIPNWIMKSAHFERDPHHPEKGVYKVPFTMKRAWQYYHDAEEFGDIKKLPTRRYIIGTKDGIKITPSKQEFDEWEQKEQFMKMGLNFQEADRLWNYRHNFSFSSKIPPPTWTKKTLNPKESYQKLKKLLSQKEMQDIAPTKEPRKPKSSLEKAYSRPKPGFSPVLPLIPEEDEDFSSPMKISPKKSASPKKGETSQDFIQRFKTIRKAQGFK
jgi:hypothetical protein